MHVGRAGGGDEAEEDEHEQLAEAVVAVGLRPAGVEPPRGDGSRPDQQQPPGRRRWRGPDRPAAATPKASERGPLHRLGRRQPGRHQPHRPDPGGVGAADAVAVVVGVVRADLQGERHHERGGRPATRSSPPSPTAHAVPTAPAPRPPAASAAGPRRPSARHPVGSGGGPGRLTAGAGTARSPGSACPCRRRGPPGPPRSGRRAAWRRRPAAGCRPGRRRPRSSTP